jgi:hypothetical protein
VRIDVSGAYIVDDGAAADEDDPGGEVGVNGDGGSRPRGQVRVDGLQEEGYDEDEDEDEDEEDDEEDDEDEEGDAPRRNHRPARRGGNDIRLPHQRSVVSHMAVDVRPPPLPC